MTVDNGCHSFLGYVHRRLMLASRTDDDSKNFLSRLIYLNITSTAHNIALFKPSFSLINIADSLASNVFVLFSYLVNGCVLPAMFLK